MGSQSFRKYAVLFVVALIIGTMTTLVSYSVTLYRLFCSLTGAAGTTQRVAADTVQRSNRTVTVFFNTDVAPGLPWRFVPAQRKVVVHLGEQVPVFFVAENRSDHAIIGHATFNVTPDKAGIYFKKIECFCFSDERLNAHQKVDMPVQFYVDPKLASDRSTEDVDQITLSYTFFRSSRPEDVKDLTRFTTANAELGATLFEAQCSSCHELDKAKVGPPLAGVVGRRAGSISGFPYSEALAKSGIVWSEQALDKWLAGPQIYVPGSVMPIAVPAEAVRRNIIAYLKTKSRTQSAEAKPPG